MPKIGKEVNYLYGFLWGLMLSAYFCKDFQRLNIWLIQKQSGFEPVTPVLEAQRLPLCYVINFTAIYTCFSH